MKEMLIYEIANIKRVIRNLEDKIMNLSDCTRSEILEMRLQKAEKKLKQLRIKLNNI